MSRWNIGRQGTESCFRVHKINKRATNCVLQIDLLRHLPAFAEAQSSLVRTKFLRIHSYACGDNHIRGGMMLTATNARLQENLMKVIHRAGLSETEKLVLIPLLKR